MAGVDRSGTVFLDTSVLLGGMIDLGVSSRAAMSIMDAVAAGGIAGPLTAWHCCLEFFSVATRLPEAFRLEPNDAYRLLQDQVLSRFEVLELPAAEREAFFSMAVESGCRGGRIYDSHIGRIAHCAGVGTVVTDNPRHCAALLRHGVRVVTSNDYAVGKGLL